MAMALFQLKGRIVNDIYVSNPMSNRHVYTVKCHGLMVKLVNYYEYFFPFVHCTIDDICYFLF